MQIDFYAHAPVPLVGPYAPKLVTPRFPRSYYIHCPDTEKGFLLMSSLHDSSMDDLKRGKSWLLHENRSYDKDAPHVKGEIPFAPGDTTNTVLIYGDRFTRVDHPTWLPNGILEFLSTPDDNMDAIYERYLSRCGDYPWVKK